MYKYDDVRIEHRRVGNQQAEHLTARLTAEASVLFIPNEAAFDMREVVESKLRKSMHRVFFGDIQDRLEKILNLIQYRPMNEVIKELHSAIDSVAEPTKPNSTSCV